MKKIFKTDISECEAFDRQNIHYERVAAKDNWYLFKMFDGATYPQFEVMKGVKHKNPDGTTVYRRPKTSEFGVYGFYICGTAIPRALERIASKNPDFDLEYFKKAAAENS